MVGVVKVLKTGVSDLLSYKSCILFEHPTIIIKESKEPIIHN